MISNSSRVMVAVSEDPAREFLADNLQADQYVALTATGVQHACCRLQDRVDVVVVDLGSETLELIDALRAIEPGTANHGVQILATTGIADPFHSIRLLERGADDVLRGPWIYPELRARLQAMLRRGPVAESHQLLSLNGLTVDVTGRRVWLEEMEVLGLSAKEFDLLATLAVDPGKVFTRAELLEGVWGLGDWTNTRTLDVHASRLRRRLEPYGGRGLIENVWGVGYRLELQSTTRQPPRRDAVGRNVAELDS